MQKEILNKIANMSTKSHRERMSEYIDRFEEVIPSEKIASSAYEQAMADMTDEIHIMLRCLVMKSLASN